MLFPDHTVIDFIRKFSPGGEMTKGDPPLPPPPILLPKFVMNTI